MSDPLQHGMHLDAEQLAAFAEGALPEHERLLVLAHTAECSCCREIAFLAQEPVHVEAPAPERTPWWRVWSQPWMFGGVAALAASALLLGVFLQTRPETAHKQYLSAARSTDPERFPERVPERTASAGAAPSPAGSAPKPDGPPSSLHNANLPGAVARGTAAGGLIGGIEAAPPAPSQPRSVQAPPPPAVPVVAIASAPQAMAKAIPETPAARMALQDKAAPAYAVSPVAASPALAASDAAATVSNAQVEQLPLSGRTAAPLRAAKARARAPLAGPLHLQIEHGSGPDDGQARMNGSVLDQSGAAIPRAVVRLSQPSSSTGAQAITDGSGRFSLPAVPAGQYQAQISAPGFAAVTQQIDLQSRDVARADAMLPVGAMSEAVEVSSVNAGMVTSADGKAMRHDRDALPGGLEIAATASSGDRTVALDAAGTVFWRHRGGHWKQVRARWSEKVAKLETSEGASEAKKDGVSAFQITTAAGAVWVSADGEHWFRR